MHIITKVLLIQNESGLQPAIAYIQHPTVHSISTTSAQFHMIHKKTKFGYLTKPSGIVAVKYVFGDNMSYKVPCTSRLYIDSMSYFDDNEGK